MVLISPVTYQGGKQRIANEILSIINPHNQLFNDYCCGSGAISIQLINQGYLPYNIIMLDKSPWGLFWQKVGDGCFSLNTFKQYIDSIPQDISLIQPWIKEMSKQPADIDTIYVYLILQAGSFGGKAIWIKNNAWQNCSFRSYWLPTATSNRRSHVNPMMPMPKTLYERVAAICEKMQGINGIYDDIYNHKPETGILYIDPPYLNTTMYGDAFNVLEYVKSVKIKTYVSEGRSLSDQCWNITSTRKKGGISGERKKYNEEWLSEFN